MLRLTKGLVLAAGASMAASIAAVHVYAMIAWHEPFFTFDVAQAIVLGFPIGLRGLVLALPAAGTLLFLRTRLSNPSFIVLAGVSGVLLGVVLAFWLRVNPDHIEPLIVAEALASTWGTAALLISLLALRRA